MGKPGYSLEDLWTLTQSSVPAQKTAAWSIMKNILINYKDFSFVVHSLQLFTVLHKGSNPEEVFAKRILFALEDKHLSPQLSCLAFFHSFLKLWFPSFLGDSFQLDFSFVLLSKCLRSATVSAVHHHFAFYCAFHPSNKTTTTTTTTSAINLENSMTSPKTIASVKNILLFLVQFNVLEHLRFT